MCLIPISPQENLGSMVLTTGGALNSVQNEVKLHGLTVLKLAPRRLPTQPGAAGQQI